MRFLPVFLDLQAGPVLLVGAGELARAKLRVLSAAGARIRWYTTDGHHDISGLGPVEAERVERAVAQILDDGYRTRDIMQAGKHNVSTREMGSAVLAALDNITA